MEKNLDNKGRWRNRKVGFRVSEEEAKLLDDLVELSGLGKQVTKTENDNYFLLTLAGIAKELRYQGREKTTHVELYAGVPLTMFGVERKAFREYLWHKEQLSFTFEGTHYCFYLDKVKIYAQCYAAIANRMGDMNRLR